MGNLVSSNRGKSKGSAVTDADRAVLTLKTQRKKLGDQRTRLDASIAREAEVARTLVAAGKKERALLALKKKKLQERQLEGVDAALLNMEEVLLNIDAAKRNQRLFDALKQGTAAIKELQAAAPLEAVEALMDESAEAKAHDQAIQQLLGERFDPADEADVLQEYEVLEAATVTEEIGQLPEAPPTPAAGVEEELPTVPAHHFVPAGKEEVTAGRVAELAS